MALDNQGRHSRDFGGIWDLVGILRTAQTETMGPPRLVPGQKRFSGARKGDAILVFSNLTAVAGRC